MTTKAPKTTPLSDPPEGKPEDMTNFNQTNISGNSHYLKDFLGNPETILVAGEHYLARARPSEMTGVRYPDLLVAFGVDPAAYCRSNAYIIEEQGKPPDFVLEIASPAPPSWTPPSSAANTKPLASPNTGASTRTSHPTAPGWPETVSLTAPTSPSP